VHSSTNTDAQPPERSLARIGGAWQSDPFASYRHKVVLSLTVATLLFFLPFVINNGLQGRHAIGACLVVFIVILLVDSHAIARGRPMPIPLWTLIVPVAGGFAFTIEQGLLIGLVWSYPTVLLFFFILPRRVALAAAAVVVLVIGTLLFWEIEFRYASRIVASLAVVAVVTNIFVGLIEDLHRKVLTQALIDPLTGAYNRRHMDTLLNAAVAAQQRSQKAASLLVIDIDHFKQVNDTWGHATGDEVLKAFVERIRQRMRTPDSLFRVGGEEFVLLLPDTLASGAQVLAEDLRQRCSQQALYGEVRATVSIGISSLRAGDTVESWWQRGDKALYQAKQSGRDRVVAGDPAPPTVPPASTPLR
jgi:diguanylate cyclase